MSAEPRPKASYEVVKRLSCGDSHFLRTIAGNLHERAELFGAVCDPKRLALFAASWRFRSEISPPDALRIAVISAFPVVPAACANCSNARASAAPARPPP